MKRRIWSYVVWDRAPDGTLVLDETRSRWEWYDGPVALAHNDPVVDQDHFRFYEPGTESGSTAIAAEDTDISRTTDTPFQVRILLQESAGSNTGNIQYELRVSKNSGAYADVTGASANVQAADDSNITDDAATTSRLVGGSGSFVAGRFDDVDGTLTSNINITASNHTEVLFSVTIPDADVADNDTLDFRVYIVNDTVLTGVYNVTGRVTVDKSAGGQSITVTQVTETDLAQTITPAPGGVNVALGQVTETNLAQAITPSQSSPQSIAVNQVAEADLAQEVTVQTAISVSLGQVTETDLAEPLTPAPGNVDIAVGQVAETDLARSVTPAPGNLDVAVGQVAETDLSQPMAISQATIVAVGQVAEADLAQAVSPAPGNADIAVGQVAEADLAQAISIATAINIAVAQVSEADLAQAIAPSAGEIVALIQVSEIDLAQPVTPLAGAVSVTLGQVTETDTALPITMGGIFPLHAIRRLTAIWRDRINLKAVWK